MIPSRGWGLNRNTPMDRPIESNFWYLHSPPPPIASARQSSYPLTLWKCSIAMSTTSLSTPKLQGTVQASLPDHSVPLSEDLRRDSLMPNRGEDINICLRWICANRVQLSIRLEDIVSKNPFYAPIFCWYDWCSTAFGHTTNPINPWKDQPKGTGTKPYKTWSSNHYPYFKS